MRAPHILNAASSLLGVSLIIVTFVHVSGYAKDTFTDELAFGAAVLFLVTCLLSQRAISKASEKLDGIADRIFLVSQILLLFAVVAFWF